MTAFVVVGLGFGDEGKGGIVDFLARRHRAVAVVRFNGGPQAGHHVVAPDGREHTFAQFGAGTFVGGVKTHLSEHMIVNPCNLLRESEGLARVGVTDALERLTIDSRAVVVTPFHVHLNRLHELLRGADRHGSCGQGVGEARADQLAGKLSVTAEDLLSPHRLLRSVLDIQEVKMIEARELIERHDGPVTDGIERELETIQDVLLGPSLIAPYRQVGKRVVSAAELERLLSQGSVVFEGAQGVLLDEAHGFQPHTTWTDTTPRNAISLLEEHDPNGAHAIRRIGVTRAYATRHGAGPFPTENAMLTGMLTDSNNITDDWQGNFRVGHLDLELLRYAIKVSGIDELAVTCLDRIRNAHDWRVSFVYENGVLEPGAGDLAERLALAKPYLERMAPTAVAYRTTLPARLGSELDHVPVSIVSHGPTAYDKSETGDPW